MAKAVGSKQKKKKKNGNINWRQATIVGVMILALLGLVLPNILPLFKGGPGPVAPSTSRKSEAMPEPKFQKEGELAFLGGESGQPLAKIDIEIADNDMERGFGLMYRRSMDENQGMLFLFDNNEPQSFWMKNTLIPLDILFVGEDMTINTIHKSTKPLSEASLPSKDNSKYVVEVNGGFTDRHGIKVGDKIQW
ncbi:MAG: DUF192 domain-containing protein [Lewinellaceae bacterium]|nr:DUF192 domain-containing protein [Saprospiraceae bacterium]MCB9338882.1 DUF192 domain-containing protein [Lewinellaceae bacterium]